MEFIVKVLNKRFLVLDKLTPIKGDNDEVYRVVQTKMVEHIQVCYCPYEQAALFAEVFINRYRQDSLDQYGRSQHSLEGVQATQGADIKQIQDQIDRILASIMDNNARSTPKLMDDQVFIELQE